MAPRSYNMEEVMFISRSRHVSFQGRHFSSGAARVSNKNCQPSFIYQPIYSLFNQRNTGCLPAMSDKMMYRLDPEVRNVDFRKQMCLSIQTLHYCALLITSCVMLAQTHTHI